MIPYGTTLVNETQDYKFFGNIQPVGDYVGDRYIDTQEYTLFTNDKQIELNDIIIGEDKELFSVISKRKYQSEVDLHYEYRLTLTT